MDDSGKHLSARQRKCPRSTYWHKPPPTGLPIRTLPVGTGSQIATVVDMQASSTGELFVSDGVGIAVFDSKATGSAAPARYIKGVTASSNGPSIVPGLIAVDRLDNVYVVNRNDSTVAVFGSAGEWYCGAIACDLGWG